jgi:hypothetical protein
MAVWLGLALLDLGPRATAAFWPTLSPPAVAVSEAGHGAEAQDPAADEQAPHVWPPAKDFNRLLLDVYCPGLGGSSAGGAGAPSTTSSTGLSTPVLGVAGQTNLLVPEFVTRFQAVPAPFIPTPLTTAIFEPPRADV